MGDIAVVVPCRNAESLVGDAIGSLAPHRDLIGEIVCVDDGSTDGTVDAIREASITHDLAVTLLEGGSQGAGAARNTGLSHIGEPFCQFLDADDLLLPGKLAHQRTTLLEGGSGVVAGAYQLKPLGGPSRVVEVDDNIWRGLITSRLGATSAMLFRTDVVLGVGGWDEDLASSQEYDLLFRLAKAGTAIASNHEALTIKRESTGAISAGEPIGRWTRFVKLRKDILDYVDGSGLSSPELLAVGHQTIFRAIQKISTHDLEVATTLLKSSVPADFVPEGESIGSRLYRMMYRGSGFENAERLRIRLEALR